MDLAVQHFEAFLSKNESLQKYLKFCIFFFENIRYVMINFEIS